MDELVEICALKGHSDRIWHASWSKDGELLATCSGDKTIRIWEQHRDSHQWHCSAILDESQSRTIRSCEWSPCKRYIAAVSFDATTVIWERRNDNYNIVATLEGHESEVKSVAWCSSGKYLATCSRDKSIWIWEADVSSDFECISVLHGHTQDVKFVKWHPTADILFSCSYDDTIKIWEEYDDDWHCTETLKGHSSTVWGISCDPSGYHVASCSDDKTIIIWKKRNQDNITSSPDRSSGWRRSCTLSGFHERTIYSIDWSYSNIIASGDGDDTIRLFRDADCGSIGSPSFELICSKYKAHSGDVNCVRWCPKADSSILVSVGDDGVVKLWKYKGDTYR